MTVVFYISGHGFGHASRAIEVVNALIERRPDVRIVVRSSVPRWFLEALAVRPIELQHADTDTGIVQIDSLRLDEDETARSAARFYEDFDRRTREEADALKQLDASLVVGDIPPLPFAAASHAGVPSVALGNFTWDWIYRGYPQFERLAPGVIGLIEGAYSTVVRALRLPFHGGFQPMAAVVRDIPLIARQARHAPAETRQLLQLDAAHPVVLASFGGHGLKLPYDQIARDGRFTLVVTDYEAKDARPPGSPLRVFTSGQLKQQGLRYEDLVAASDVVATKPGYGIVSECVANDTALLYTSRGHFVENEVFVSEMPRVLRCRYISQADLLAGHWAESIIALLAQPPAPDRFATNGSAVVAEALLAKDW